MGCLPGLRGLPGTGCSHRPAGGGPDVTRQVLRLRLEKSGDARFISHLDFMRTLTHAFVRA
ncbi:MAG: DUF2344 domain-containing protein, partial [Bacillota bacterium]